MKYILLSALFFLSLVSCSKESEFLNNTIVVNEGSVTVNGKNLEVINGKVESVNYNIIISSGELHIYSLLENFEEIISVNHPYTLKERGSMYFIIEIQKAPYPIEILFTSLL